MLAAQAALPWESLTASAAPRAVRPLASSVLASSPVPSSAGVNDVRLQLAERRQLGVGGHARADRVLEAVAVGEDRLAGLAGQEVQELLGRGLVLG